MLLLCGTSLEGASQDSLAIVFHGLLCVLLGRKVRRKTLWPSCGRKKAPLVERFCMFVETWSS